MVAMLSASSPAPYQLAGSMPMHPRAIGNTEGPLRPSRALLVVVMSSTPPLRLEIARPVEIGNQPGLLRLPPEQFTGSLTRGRVVECSEMREPFKVIHCFLVG